MSVCNSFSEDTNKMPTPAPLPVQAEPTALQQAPTKSNDNNEKCIKCGSFMTQAICKTCSVRFVRCSKCNNDDLTHCNDCQASHAKKRQDQEMQRIHSEQMREREMQHYRDSARIRELEIQLQGSTILTLITVVRFSKTLTS